MASERLDNIRHSCAHLLAQAVLQLFPGTQLTIGPTTETGFFYDFLPQENFKEADLARIEERMKELAQTGDEITGGQVPKTEARELFKDNPFKLELIDGIPGDTVGIYHQGDFTDLCRGGHVKNTKELKAFKLTTISGSYWRADRNGQPLQRISGFAFETPKELRLFLKKREEAKKFDHRVLGKQLDLFSFHQESPGAPFYHGRGAQLFNSLVEFSRQTIAADYQEIKTPLIMHEKLWKQSGHYDNYKENMYFTQIDDEYHCVRPMNCPSALMVYKQGLHSHNHLPVRLAEYGLVHRYELSGVLAGLFRVRTFTQDDGHVFCTPDQVEAEVIKMLELADITYKKFGFTDVQFALSTKPVKAIGSDDLWDRAIEALANALKSRGISYTLQEGEGAFYGPKIELLVKDSLERQWQCGTIQLDFFLPKNFETSYVDGDQSRQTPVMIHRAILGSIERFMGILLEHTKGHLPFFVAPEQIRILTITDEQADYAQDLLKKMRGLGYRVSCDSSSDMINAKIKRAQLLKIPTMLVVGEKEKANGTVTLRYVTGKQAFGLTLDELTIRLAELG